MMMRRRRGADGPMLTPGGGHSHRRLRGRMPMRPLDHEDMAAGPAWWNAMLSFYFRFWMMPAAGQGALQYEHDII